MDLTAADLATEIQHKRVSARASVEASLRRIAELNEQVRAFITICEDEALREADEVDARLRRGEQIGTLAGIPIAIKDLVDTKGIRTTYGSLTRAAYVPDRDDIAVERLRAAGAIVVGKTNTPEFGLGSDVTTNSLYGPTANPYRIDLTSGASSGGSAVAVATGMVPLADGTDFGGSVRQPASYCNIVGVRPTPGLVPIIGKARLWEGSIVHGTFGRTVEDASLMLETMIGPDQRDPVSLCALHPNKPAFRSPALSELRLAISPDLGLTPIDPEVADAFQGAVLQIINLFPSASFAHPDCSGVQRTFQSLRAVQLYRDFHTITDQFANEVSPRLCWEVDRGRNIDIHQYLSALEKQSEIYLRFMAFFERFDLLATVSAATPPFPNDQAGAQEINGVSMQEPNEYHAITYVFSLVGLPAMSIPCGLTASGLPVGLQLVARPCEDFLMLAFAHKLEEELGFRHTAPTGPVRGVRSPTRPDARRTRRA
jgi:amidase